MFRRADESTDRPLRLPAWTASLLAHAALLTLVVWLAGPRAPRGAADEPTREVGVVLRRAPVTPFDPSLASEADAPTAEATEPVDQPTPDPAGVFATADTPSPFADLLEALTAEGASAGRPTTSLENGQGEADRGAGRGRALPIGQARTTFFGVEGEGSRFVYVLDRSVSMAGPPLATAKRELLASLESLGDIHQFQIVFFNHRLLAFDLTGGQRRIAQATDQNKRKAADRVSGVTADGSTDRYGALAHALRLRPDVVFFLTDADDPMTPEQLRELARLNDRQGATIGAIEFGRGPGGERANFLTNLAEATGGQYRYVDVLRLGD